MNRLVAGVIVGALSSAVFAAQRIPIIEDFSSSTCPPCASFNNNTFNPFLQMADMQGKYTCISYRMNWPGSGDPYFNTDGQTRRYFYNVAGVPDCYIDAGKPDESSPSAFASSINQAGQVDAPATVSATFQLTGDSRNDARISVEVTVTPTDDISDAKLYIAVCEKRTTGNAASNGETEFFHVMMKMLPAGAGQSIDLSANTPVTMTEEASLAQTDIEELSDLEVVAWVQESGSKQVVQSAWANQISDPDAVVPRDPIASHEPLVSYNSGTKSCLLADAAGAAVSVYDLTGKRVAFVNSLQTAGTMDLRQLPRGLYIVNLVRGDAAISKRITVTR
jgi:hypothetical protein